MGHRLLRVNERIKESVSVAIAGRIKDPRVGFVTVTGVETTSDLRHAKVFVSVLGTPKEREATLGVLQQACGLLQASITAGLRMKRTPQITFVYDPTPAHAQHMERLIRREQAELEARSALAQDDEADTPDSEGKRSTDGGELAAADSDGEESAP